MFQTVSRLLSKLQLNSELSDFTKHAVTTGLQLMKLVGKVLGFLVTNKPDKNASLASITHPHTHTHTHTHTLTPTHTHSLTHSSLMHNFSTCQHRLCQVSLGRGNFYVIIYVTVMLFLLSCHLINRVKELEPKKLK